MVTNEQVDGVYNAFMAFDRTDLIEVAKSQAGYRDSDFTETSKSTLVTLILDSLTLR